MPPQDQQQSPYPKAPDMSSTPPQPYPLSQPVSGGKQGPRWLLIIPLILFILLFFAASGFGYWANSQLIIYRDKSDQKVASAVEKAVEDTEAAKEKEFLEREKSPFRQYKGPATFGSLAITYPKTWSAAVTETDTGSVPVDGYLHPGFVPGAKSGTAFALRIEVLEQPYDRVLKTYESKAKKGEVRILPYKAPKVPQVLGSRVNGEVIKDEVGSAVLFPLRDKTIRISTYSQQFVPDFNNTILPNLVFVP